MIERIVGADFMNVCSKTSLSDMLGVKPTPEFQQVAGRSVPTGLEHDSAGNGQQQQCLERIYDPGG